MSHLIYFDPSGEGSESSEPIVVVAAVIAHMDRQMPRINSDVRLIRKLLPEDQRSRFEFKADKLFRHVRKFGDESQYKPVLLKFLGMMRSRAPRIQWSAVHRAGYAQMRKQASNVTSARDMAFLVTCVLVELWFREHAAEEAGLCIADKGRAEIAMHDIMRDLRAIGIPQAEVEAFDHIVDTIMFADSKTSIGVQMADVASYFTMWRATSCAAI